MSRYLLDTNALSDLVRHPQGDVQRRVAELGPANVCTSIIVVAEARFGTRKRGSRRLSQQLAAVLAGLDILAFETPADEFYAELRADLERRGLPIGANDMLIAAHALAIGCTLVTANEREFSRIPGLKVENWLRALSH